MASGVPLIEFWRYQLRPLGALNSSFAGPLCEGALIRCNDGVGCLHPWPSLGDASIDKQLALLSRGVRTPLAQRALDCCAVDGAARREDHELFSRLSIPRSHATLAADESWIALAERVNTLRAEGFDTVKMKASGDAGREAGRVNAVAPVWSGKIRLDFNNALNPGALREFAALLSPETATAIDFIEDPFPYDATAWRALQAETGLTFALDRGSEHHRACRAFPVRIWKPACSSQPSLHREERLVVTSNMDHAIGQVFAAYEAAKLAGAVDICGLVTHPLFEPDPFFEQLAIDGARLAVPGGPGLGFGATLEALPWKKLN